MQPAENLLSSELQVDPIAQSHLNETARWANLLAMVGFFMSVLLALIGLFFDSVDKAMSNGYAVTENSFLVTIFYIVIAAVYFAMSVFMFRFSGKMKTALQITDQENFNAALYNLKMVYRITGIIVIIYLALIALAFIIYIAAAAFGS